MLLETDSPQPRYTFRGDELYVRPQVTSSRLHPNPYAEGDFEPTEELYNTGRDPLERTNLASVDSAATDLKRMRALYDQAVADWKKSAVPYHNYQSFGDFFSRSE